MHEIADLSPENSNFIWFNLTSVSFDLSNSFMKQLLLTSFYERGHGSLARLCNTHRVKQSISSALFFFFFFFTRQILLHYELVTRRK